MIDDPLLEYLRRSRTECKARLRELELGIDQREREVREEAKPPEGFPVGKGPQRARPAPVYDGEWEDE